MRLLCERGGGPVRGRRTGGRQASRPDRVRPGLLGGELAETKKVDWTLTLSAGSRNRRNIRREDDKWQRRGPELGRASFTLLE